MTKIKKLLVANRGEIALRILKTAKDLGISTVAIYSEADEKAMHVRYADEAFCVGPPPSSESYLCGDKIIDICLKHHVDAIHPGYGFLSENAEFAKAVAENGLIFIGPSPEAIRIMGDKLMAKSAVAEFDVPLVPGTDGAIEDISEAQKLSSDIGYPVLIKASAGGGGKGMRVVEKDSDIEEQMKRAVSEAKSAFGDGSVFIEKFITSPRHIEIQVLGDKHGNVVSLFERECSIQRRHQKVIEEAPSSILTPEERKEMGDAAIAVAKSCQYVGAGTVEFIFDQDRNFYFLEMNTRLQVEHPVTEMITGIDLVKEQIRIAEGEPLPFSQEDLKINGHAIEARIYAEDPSNQFLPDIGSLQTYKTPSGPGVRVDDSYEPGMSIPIYYDPMIAKLITYGATREEARKRMIRAIDEYEITGIQSTLSFCRLVMTDESFISGKFDTKFIDQHFNPDNLTPSLTREIAEIAAVLAVHSFKNDVSDRSSPTIQVSNSNWKKRNR